MRTFIARPVSLALLLAGLLCGGCTPLRFPAVERLEPNRQAEVEDMWVNMLSPTGRLDRDLLLDVVSLYQLHSAGVDRLTMRSEKDYIGGRVSMEIAFDRMHPEADAFRIKIFDPGGRLVRAERYTGQ